MQEFGMWAVTWRTSQNHKTVKLGMGHLYRGWALARDNTVTHNMPGWLLLAELCFNLVVTNFLLRCTCGVMKFISFKCLPKSRCCLRLDAISDCPNELSHCCTSSIVVCTFPIGFRSNPSCCKLSITCSGRM